MIYFILDERANNVKIGYSHEPENRLRQLQTGSPSKLIMLAVIPGTITEERALHLMFHEYREVGEWFRYEGSLAVYIDNLLEIDLEKVEQFNFNKPVILTTQPLSSYLQTEKEPIVNNYYWLYVCMVVALVFGVSFMLKR